MSNDQLSSFEQRGFLSDELVANIPTVRDQNADLFQIAEEVNVLQMRVALEAAELARTNLQSPEAVAVRLLLRACGTFQSIVILTERGIVADARTLARSILEDAFAVAALVTDPVGFMAKYLEDTNEALRRQIIFITKQNLSDAEVLEKLKEKLRSSSSGDTLNLKALALMGPLAKQYLSYQRLSNDSAHPSATALSHHVYKEPGASGWIYTWQIADEDTNAATLHTALQGALATAIGVVELLSIRTFDGAFDPILKQLQALPTKWI